MVFRVYMCMCMCMHIYIYVCVCAYTYVGVDPIHRAPDCEQQALRRVALGLASFGA